MKKIIITLSAITLCLLVAQIVYSCMLVGDGKEIRRIDGKITAIGGENALLSEQVASASLRLSKFGKTPFFFVFVKKKKK